MQVPSSAVLPVRSVTRGSPACYHCGLPVPDGFDAEVEVDGHPQPVCCHGCEAAVLTVLGLGLEAYYQRRLQAAPRPEPRVAEAMDPYDAPAIEGQYVLRTAENECEVALMLEGVSCPACMWLNEQRLAALPGVSSASANYATQRLLVRWDPARARLSTLLRAVRELGYTAYPYDPARVQAGLARTRREALRRIGVAAAFGMQVMMVAIALYAGDWYGMEAEFRNYFNWVALGLSLPVVLYSAQPFYEGALRDLRNRRLGMDVPVSLALIGGTLGSIATTISGGGPTYYDSLTMFVFLLLGARYVEFSGRAHAMTLIERLAASRPAVAIRLDGNAGTEHEQAVPVVSLVAGDRVRVRPGENIPADGVIESGRSSVDQSLLTGEDAPQPRAPGDEVLGGSVNVEGPLVVRVVRTGSASVMGHLLTLIERSARDKPHLTALADVVARYFTGSVLLLALAAAVYWSQVDPARALPVVISVLVVSCPCALSLAAPAALSAAGSGLLREGVLVARAGGIEALARVDRVVFDKTGTLTLGRQRVMRVVPAAPFDAATVLRWAAALEVGASHPVGRAILAAAGADVARATAATHVAGRGVHGFVAGRAVRIGTAAFTGAHDVPAEDVPPGLAPTVVYVTIDGRTAGCILLADAVREESRAVLDAVRTAGAEVSLLSGDAAGAVRAVAETLGIATPVAGCTPQSKLERVRAWQAAGEHVLMVGDGVNDAPVLAAADASMAIGSGSDLARTHADFVLLGDLSGVVRALDMARRTLSVVRQNVAWAILYNGLLLPAALVGFVPPWLAAIAMSTSSVLVVVNAARLARRAG